MGRFLMGMQASHNGRMDGFQFHHCKSGKDRWRIVHYRCNYSKFNGSHRTPSAYSALTCLDCGQHWRTNAAYVDRLQFLQPGDREL